MIAVAIIGVLASVSIPAFQNYQNRSRRAEAFANLAAIAKLEKQQTAALAAGDSKAADEAGEALAARRQWLVQAERALAEFGG